MQGEDLISRRDQLSARTLSHIAFRREVLNLQLHWQRVEAAVSVPHRETAIRAEVANRNSQLVFEVDRLHTKNAGSEGGQL